MGVRGGGELVCVSPFCIFFKKINMRTCVSGGEKLQSGECGKGKEKEGEKEGKVVQRDGFRSPRIAIVHSIGFSH